MAKPQGVYGTAGVLYQRQAIQRGEVTLAALKPILAAELKGDKAKTVATQVTKSELIGVHLSSSVARLLFRSEVAASSLFPLNRLEQSFEIAFAEAAASFALNHFVEQRRPVFHGLGKDLQHVAFVVAIHKNAQVG